MSETSIPTSGADRRASPDSGDRGTTEQAKQKASEVAGQAQEKTQEARQQAKSRMQQTVDERSTEVGEQVVSAADAVRPVADKLRSQGQDAPARVVEQATERAQRVGSKLRDENADQLLSEIEDMARRQPWAVVAGGIALGFAAARFLKASSNQRYQQRQS